MLLSHVSDHAVVHSGKQFKCTVCDHTAAQKPQLLRHMEQHASFKDLSSIQHYIKYPMFRALLRFDSFSDFLGFDDLGKRLSPT
ncbi:zinc finger protein ZFAT isoform 1 [Cricetulus griseus]|nr:zinc finger protein ZFAT isoform 1 [Cricetulus griseus]